jgi:hypothetical protein
VRHARTALGASATTALATAPTTTPRVAPGPAPEWITIAVAEATSAAHAATRTAFMTTEDDRVSHGSTTAATAHTTAGANAPALNMGNSRSLTVVCREDIQALADGLPDGGPRYRF